MPSAPAFSASRAARTGSGSLPPRAFRTVATWSILTPRRSLSPCMPALSLCRRACRRTAAGETLAPALAVGDQRLVDQQVNQCPDRQPERHAADRQRLHDRPELVPGFVQQVVLKPRWRRPRLLIEDQTAELIGARPDEGIGQRISKYRPADRAGDHV